MAKPLALSFALPFDEAIAAATARKVVLPAEYYGSAAAGARRAATTISGLTALDQVQAVIDSVTSAIANGRAFGDWKREAEDKDWRLPPGRLETIFRTNVQTAYAAGHWTAFQANKARRPYLMWSAINDSRVRPAHLAMDGHIAPVDDPIWRVWHPPAGYNCRCSQISLTETQARARGYGRQGRLDLMPDPGFEGGNPGDLEGAIARAKATKVGKVASQLRVASGVRDAAEAARPIAQGPRVSSALTLPGDASLMARELRETLNIIDRVHGDGALPSIPVRIINERRFYGGYRSHQNVLDSAVEIVVSEVSPTYRMTLTHEIGHFLDHKGWGGAGMSSPTQAAAEAWRVAIRQSPSYQRLVEFLDDEDANFRRHAVYATDAIELWARSYAQWIALRSGDVKMAGELAAMRSNRLEINRIGQWGDLEFQPIAKAIDDLFVVLGWRRP